MQLTNADRGLMVYEALSQLKTRAMAKVQDLQEVAEIKQVFDSAVEQLVASTGVRLKPTQGMNSFTTEQEAVVLATTARRAQAFLTTLLRSTQWKATIMPPNTKLRNVVDCKVYDHLATVEHDRIVRHFCIDPKGGYIMSDKKYWASVDV